jgi:hypothetical protein
MWLPSRQLHSLGVARPQMVVQHQEHILEVGAGTRPDKDLEKAT